MRKLIVHYHIFKNAGTSVDRVLKESFGDRWKLYDSQNTAAKISPNELRDFIEENPDELAISSHHCIPPIPKGDFEVFPLIFFRHPYTRAYSAYSFEWGKQKKLDKPEGSFDDYVQDKFTKPRRNAIEDFQVRHVANQGHGGRGPSDQLSDEEILVRAERFVDSLPFFGLVEQFNESMVRANYYLRPHFPDFEGVIYSENVTSKGKSDLDARVERVISELSEETREEFQRRNALDLAFYRYAADRFAHMGWIPRGKRAS